LYELASAPAAKLTMLFHDYLAICPSFTLFDSSNRYCGIPGDVKECRACLSRNPHAIRKDIDIVEWRWHWGRLVDVANEVRFFSHDSAKLASKVWKISNSKKRVVAHSPLIDYKGRKVSVRRDGEVIIGVVGAIGFIKGAEVVQQMSHLLKKRDPRAKIVVIGMIDPHYRDESMTNVTVHGHYERAHLPQLLEQYGVSVAVVPSIVPETFSYVTQELMMLDMPVACFGLGAPAERVGAYPKGRVVTEISAEAMIDAIYEMSGRKAITRAA
jgi:glycosyltransferase involved in cell wall biosynthesis